MLDETVLYISLTLFPRRVMLATMPTATITAIRAYSMDVTPDRSFTKRAIRFGIMTLLLLQVGPGQPLMVSLACDGG
jgi:hypothetical protein